MASADLFKGFMLSSCALKAFAAVSLSFPTGIWNKISFTSVSNQQVKSVFFPFFPFYSPVYLFFIMIIWLLFPHLHLVSLSSSCDTWTVSVDMKLVFSLHLSCHSSFAPICVFLIFILSLRAEQARAKRQSIFSFSPPFPLALNIPFSPPPPPVSSLVLFSFSFHTLVPLFYCPPQFPRPV